MSFGILANIEKLIMKNNALSGIQTKKIIDFLKKGNYIENKLITPNAVMKELNISAETAYNLFELLKSNKIVKEFFGLYCQSCNKYIPGFYEFYGDIPKYSECDSCYKPLYRNSSVVVKFSSFAYAKKGGDSYG